MYYGGIEYITSLLLWTQQGTIEGFYNLPSPPCVLVVNHVGPYDPPLLVRMLYPWIKKYNKKLVYLTNPKVLAMFGPFHKTFGTFKGTKQGLKQALGFLKKGTPVCIFANRDRLTKTLKRFHLGPAYLASIANVPLVPMGLIAKHEVFPSGDFLQMIKNAFFKKNLIIGKPFFVDKKLSLAKVTEELTLKVAEMIGKTMSPR
ncbi:MAG: 1-acyl-sn-glycerol-3-phosphate acyltransferase [Candidatus Latescibacteria bacterium]|nr:1-acyl-sn-glycerol-3-phosphate acyltransferase [Candidatus Latescibacterota bacterium]